MENFSFALHLPVPPYILLAASAATIGIFLSNMKDLKVGKRGFIVPLLFLVASWIHVTMACLAKYEKGLASGPFGFVLHLFVLLFFVISGVILFRLFFKALLRNRIPD